MSPLTRASAHRPFVSSTLHRPLSATSHHCLSSTLHAQFLKLLKSFIRTLHTNVFPYQSPIGVRYHPRTEADRSNLSRTVSWHRPLALSKTPRITSSVSQQTLIPEDRTNKSHNALHPASNYFPHAEQQPEKYSSSPAPSGC